MEAGYPGTARASFELERLEFGDGRLLVSGWWFGVRGMRFVRPALLVDGRKVLATLEHKPWAAGSDGAWTAAFPWKDGNSLDMGGVTLVVAPSVEVPLDREAEPEPVVAAVVAAGAPPALAPVPVPVPPSLHEQSLRVELEALERRLTAMRDELHETRALAAEREARCRELERAATREHRLAEDAGASRDATELARAMAVLDRDRAVQQLEEVLLAHRSQQERLKGEWASSERALPLPPADPEPAPTVEPRARPLPRPRRAGPAAEQHSGVRVIPATRTVRAHLHRAPRERDHGVTGYDMWAIRVLGSVAAVSSIALLVMILKAVFIF